MNELWPILLEMKGKIINFLSFLICKIALVVLYTL